jgi:hypothetical protein
MEHNKLQLWNSYAENTNFIENTLLNCGLYHSYVTNKHIDRC